MTWKAFYIYRNSDGNLYVRYLYWNGDRWNWNYNWLNNDWNSKFNNTYNNIISIENLLDAWREFVKGKKQRKDVQEFERNLMFNIILLHKDLVTKTYRHGSYEAFNISDPKPRNIHKAKVRDRLLHHALYRKLYPFFNRTFISDSYSCRFSGLGAFSES